MGSAVMVAIVASMLLVGLGGHVALPSLSQGALCRRQILLRHSVLAGAWAIAGLVIETILDGGHAVPC